MRVFLNEVKGELQSPVPWVACVTICLVVAITGPYGSYGAMGFTRRLLLWTPAIIAAGVSATVIRAMVYATFDLLGTLKGSLLVTACNSLVLTPLVYLLMRSVLPPELAGSLDLTEIAILIATISLGVCVLRISARATLTIPSVAPNGFAAGEADLPRLLRRLEPEQRGDIWAISVRDHYVDVQTSRGKASLLMRFSDAVSEVDTLGGTQVHRSHWVAWAGVGSVCRDGGKMVLHLHNGQQIPVSRNHRDKVDAQFAPLSSRVKSA